MENRNVFAENLQYYMSERNVSRKEISDALGISYFTVTSWVNGKKYPRMDKVELLADYFGILKSDLIEEKLTEEKEKDNDIMSDIIIRMRMDEEFFSLVESLYNLDSEKIKGVRQMLNAFTK